MIKSLTNSLTPLYPPEEARAIVFALLEDAFGLTRTDVLLGRAASLTDDEKSRLTLCMQRLQQGEPLQHVVGFACFGDLRLKVTPATLIPRPETLELVDWVASDNASAPHPHILDIGTGSGCIAISLALRLPQAHIAAWDISQAALTVAQCNAEKYDVKIDFQLRDALKASNEAPRFTTIVSNPPYICEHERKDMERNVLDFEPATALFVPDTDPLLFYKALAARGKELLLPNGSVYMEINRAYGKEVCQLFEQTGYTHVTLRKDTFGNDRMVKATLPS
jgi:release factor glutamine methyltransferase